MVGNDVSSPFAVRSPFTALRQFSVPTLLQLRNEGRCRDDAFAHWMRYGSHTIEHQNWKLSIEKRIQSSTPYSMCSSLDLSPEDARFLLTGGLSGTVSIYDFEEVNTRQHAQYHPLQQAETNPSSICSVQWYHDTGIFLTASKSGSVLLWDTAAMAPVLEAQPFQFNEFGQNSCHCMAVAPHATLAVAGSLQSPHVKLIDLNSGASSHTLRGCNSGPMVSAQSQFARELRWNGLFVGYSPATIATDRTGRGISTCRRFRFQSLLSGRLTLLGSPSLEQ